EDGIRDRNVTGVQTCALPISCVAWGFWFFGLLPIFDYVHWIPATLAVAFLLVSLVLTFGAFGMWGTPTTGGRDYGEAYEESFSRSEERRGGKGCGVKWRAARR